MTKERLAEKLEEAIRQCNRHIRQAEEQLDKPPMPAGLGREAETPAESLMYWEGSATAYASALMALKQRSNVTKR